MRSLLTLATAGCWFATEGLGAAVELGKRDDNITLAAPVVGVPSEHWYVYTSCLLSVIHS